MKQWAAILLLLSGCSDSNAAALNGYAFEDACITKSKAMVNDLIRKQAFEEVKNYDNPNGYIPGILRHRREIERLCMVAARCHKSNSMQTVEFSDCLDGWNAAGRNEYNQ